MIAALRTRVHFIRNASEIPAAMNRLVEAQNRFAQLTQLETDHIFAHVAKRMKQHSFPLARYAVAESGIGLVEDKTLKNLYGCEYTYRRFKDLKTAGLVYSDPLQGVEKYAEPVGPICALVPCTNPTATVIIKSLSALKTRNSVVFLPHPRTATASAYAAKLIHDYAVEAGAPKDVVMCGYPDRDVSHGIMNHPDVKFLLATGGSAMIDSCYSAKKPTIAVGPGNAPVLVDADYDLKEAVNSIVIGKTYDNGTICAGEQNVIFPDTVYEKASALMEERGVYILTENEKDLLGKIFMPEGHKGSINPEIVGKSARVIAEMAGIQVPNQTLVLGVECSNDIGAELFSHEKLSPILGIFKCRDFEHGTQLAHDLVEHGGKGHTAAVYSDNARHVEMFHSRVRAYHIVVNMPSSLGVIGIRYNTAVDPTMTVGVGSHGGSIASENVSCKHLMQLKVVNRKVPLPEPGAITLPQVHRDINALSLEPSKRVVMLGNNIEVENQLRTLGVELELSDTQSVSRVLREHRADVLVAVGSESTLHTAKLARVLHDNPSVTLDDLTDPVMEFSWREPLQKKTSLICIPSGSARAVPAAVSNVVAKPLGPTLQSADIIHPDCTADTVIVDRSLLRPDRHQQLRFVTLVKALEAYISSVNSTTTKATVKEQLTRLLQDENDTYDACIRVEACVNSTGGPGLTSVIADVVSRHFKVDPVHVMAAALPRVMAYMVSDIPTRINATPNVPYVRTREDLTELGLSYEELVERILAGRLKTLKHCDGLNVDEYLLHVPQMADEIFTHPLGKGAPRVLLVDEIADMLEKLVGYY